MENSQFLRPVNTLKVVERNSKFMLKKSLEFWSFLSAFFSTLNNIIINNKQPYFFVSSSRETKRSTSRDANLNLIGNQIGIFVEMSTASQRVKKPQPGELVTFKFVFLFLSSAPSISNIKINKAYIPNVSFEKSV